MARPRLLSVLVLANALVSVLSCGGGGPSPCSWTTCRHEWRNDWGPGISQGRCVNQRRNAHHITSSHSGSGSCPSPSGCSPQTQYRTMCKYSIVWFRCGVGENWNPFNCYRCLDLTNRSRRELFQISDIQIYFFLRNRVCVPQMSYFVLLDRENICSKFYFYLSVIQL